MCVEMRFFTFSSFTLSRQVAASLEELGGVSFGFEDLLKKRKLLSDESLLQDIEDGQLKESSPLADQHRIHRIHRIHRALDLTRSANLLEYFSTGIICSRDSLEEVLFEDLAKQPGRP